MGNLKSLQLAARNLKDVLKNIGINKSVDPCPVCENELYYEKDLTRRCGLLNEHDEIIGWLCPHCRSEFDGDDNLVEIFTGMKTKGNA